MKTYHPDGIKESDFYFWRGRFFLFPLLFYLESNLVKIVGLKDYCGRGLSVVHGDAGPPLRWRVGRRPVMRDVNKIAHVSMHEI